MAKKPLLGWFSGGSIRRFIGSGTVKPGAPDRARPQRASSLSHLLAELLEHLKEARRELRRVHLDHPQHLREREEAA